ncbi:uncharacterized protein LOC142624880 [Castanea sativa]|uniref:uncharacterized protein LOC142624880 n=1 Tax=Castanea sativa TaxID=21020 RepID=UPI003F650876
MAAFTKVDHFTTEQITNNQLQLKASVFIVRYLAFQAVAFRGQDESFSSLNRGKFLESLGIMTFWNEKVAEIIEKTLKNATYTSPRIQKEILHVFSAKVKKAIQEEIGDANLIDLEELEIGSGLNQIGTLQRPVETRWSSHFRSVSSLLRMFTSTVEVLLNIIDDAIDGEHRAKTESAYDGLTSFEFVFILHLEKKTMEITDKLCQDLQSQFRDILNAMHLVSSTKELNHRFNEDEMELLRLSSALEPREALKSFRSSDIFLLVKNLYPQDFTDYDKQVLEKELYHFEHNVVQDPKFKKLKSLSELCQWLVRTRNSEHYKLVYRMVRLVLTLPVSTATTEQAFSAMKVVKTNLRSKMENDFFTDSLMLYIVKDIVSTFSLDSVVDDFEDLKEHQVPFS